MAETICSIDGCEKVAFTRGWCTRHYHRWQRYRDPRGGGPQRADYLNWLKGKVSYDGDECLIWPFFKTGDGRAGYLKFRGKQVSASRVMCFLVNGEPPTPKSQAAHSCGRGHEACVHPRHLRWATPKENQLDRYRDGTDIAGDKNPHAKLSASNVRKIRQLVPLLRGKMSQSDIGRLFNVSGSCISAIMRHENWSRIK